MLNLDSATVIRGIVTYRDFNDSGLYWYMPASPQLAREGGQPLFQLLMYRRDITDNPDFQAGGSRGGGFLTMTVDLEVSSGTLEAVKAELASRAGRSVRLAPVPFEDGSVRITALGVSAGAAPGTSAAGDDEERTGPGFVENILGSAKPSMYGDNRVVFSLELSTEGAQLMRASLEDDGASAIAVVYDMKYTGLMPAREVEIVIKFRQSYSHLRTRAVANSLWFKADIDAEMETLRKEGAIEINDVSYLELEPDKLAERATELQELAKQLAQWTFFKPGLKPGEVLAKDRGEISVYDPSEAAAAHTAGFTTPLDLMLTGAGRTEAGGPALVRGSTERSGGVRGSESTSATATAPTPQPATPRERQPTAVERWNQAGRPQAGFLMRSLDQEERQEITFNLRQVSAQKRDAAPQGSIRLLSGDAALKGRIKQVDLNDLFWETLAGTVRSSADFAVTGVHSMVVQLRYGIRDDGSSPKDTAEFQLRSPEDVGEYRFFMDRQKSIEIEYRVTVHYRADYAIGDDATSFTSEWLRTSTRNLDIDPRSVQGLIPVTLTAGQVDWEAVESIQSAVLYTDPPDVVDQQRTVVISQESATASVPIRPKNPDVRNFVVTSTFFLQSGQREVIEEARANDPDVVLNQPVSKAVPVSITAVDPLNRLAKATVELAYQAGADSPEQRTLKTLTGAGSTESWVFFRPALTSEPKYRFRVTLFGQDGTTDAGEWTETTERQLIVGDRFPGMLDVSVLFVGGADGDLTASGFQLVKLTLEYPGAPEGIDNREEETFRGRQAEPFLWRVPSATREPGEYSYKVMYVGSDGTVTEQEGTSTDETLLLFIPEAGS